MTSPADHRIARLTVLAAVAAAVRAARAPRAPVDHVAFELGRVRPDLLNSRRERLLTELRRDGLVSYANGAYPGWRLTAAGYDLLAAEGLPV